MPTRPFYVNQLSGGTAPVPPGTASGIITHSFFLLEFGPPTYLEVGGLASAFVGAAEWEAQYPSPITGTLQDVTVSTQLNLLTGPNTFTIRVNGVPSIIVWVLDGASLPITVVPGIVAVNQGDLISVEEIPSGGGGTAAVSISYSLV